MRAFVTACFLLFAAPVAADLPALFDVHGVAGDDALNVRQEPSAESDIIGTLAPDHKSVEVIRLSEDDRWALINLNEGTAWASAKFLQRSSKLTLIPQPMRCFGTEPFWNLNVTWPTSSPAVDFSLFGGTKNSYAVQRADGLYGRTVIMAGPRENDDVHLLAAVKPQYCDDGMSDREFGLGIELFVLNQGSWQNHTGCCSLAP